jgi:hypothetical protein
VNAVSLAKNITDHFGIPTAGLVAEVHSGFEQLFH